MTAQQLLTCVTWNVHRGYGGDGRKDPARIVDVLCQEVWSKGTDILVLQEADADEPPHPGVADPEQVEARTGLRYLHRDVSHRLTGQSHGFLGLVTYAAPHIMVEGMGLIDLPGICARGAVVVDLVVADVPLRLVATHLSLGQALRIAQTRTISQYLARRDPRQVILCGDLNEWRPWGGFALSPRVLGQRYSGPARASFPVGRPLFPLDRILTTAPGQVHDAEVLDGPGIRAASDHRPLRARVSFGPATSERTRRPS